MANQFTTGQGQGYPEDDDPMKRTLASGVNAGQAQPNLDPGKIGNPYEQPGAAPKPPPLPGANPYAPANPYEPPAAQSRRSAASMPVTGSVVTQRQQAHANGGATPPPTPEESERINALTSMVGPGGGSTTANPMASQGQAGYMGGTLPQLTASSTGLLVPSDELNRQTQAAGAGLRAAAGIDGPPVQTPLQIEAEKEAEAQNYQKGAYDASAHGGGVSGFANQVAASAANAGAMQREKSRAGQVDTARSQYLTWTQQQNERQNQDLNRLQAEADRRLEAYKAMLASSNLSEHDKQVAIQAQKDRDSKQITAIIGGLFGLGEKAMT